MSDEFLPGRHLGAGALNRLAKTADSAHLGFAGFLAHENGAEQVPRNPRRTDFRSAGVPIGAGVPARITGVSGGVYSIALYGGGPSNGRTGTGLLVLPEVQQFTALATGTWILAHPIRVAAERTAAEDDEEKEGAES